MSKIYIIVAPDSPRWQPNYRPTSIFEISSNRHRHLRSLFHVSDRYGVMLLHFENGGRQRVN